MRCLECSHGVERDRWIARSKVVLMLRHDERHRIFEIVRAAYLMTNGRAIVSEWDGGTSIDADFAPGVALATVGNLGATCRTLVGNAAARSGLGRRAREVIGARRQDKILRHAIARLPAGVFAGQAGP